ncbi:hypothetical protein KCU70_g326, partial [Aureobasidium melanogenum]
MVDFTDRNFGYVNREDLSFEAQLVHVYESIHISNDEALDVVGWLKLPLRAKTVSLVSKGVSSPQRGEGDVGAVAWLGPCVVTAKVAIQGTEEQSMGIKLRHLNAAQRFIVVFRDWRVSFHGYTFLKIEFANRTVVTGRAWVVARRQRDPSFLACLQQRQGLCRCLPTIPDCSYVRGAPSVPSGPTSRKKLPLWSQSFPATTTSEKRKSSETRCLLARSA